MVDEKQRVIRQEALSENPEEIEVEEKEDIVNTLGEDDYEKLFNTWVNNEKYSTEDDQELIQRVENYLKYEEKLCELRKRIAKKKYEKFIVSTSSDAISGRDFKEVNIEVICQGQTTLSAVYTLRHRYDDNIAICATIQCFKRIAIACEEKIALYINDSGYIDLYLWLMYNTEKYNSIFEENKITIICKF